MKEFDKRLSDPAYVKLHSLQILPSIHALLATHHSPPHREKSTHWQNNIDINSCTKATVVLCLSAIFCSTGLFNTTGSLSALAPGRSGDPNGEYAVTTIPK